MKIFLILACSLQLPKLVDTNVHTHLRTRRQMEQLESGHDAFDDPTANDDPFWPGKYPKEPDQDLMREFLPWARLGCFTFTI